MRGYQIKLPIFGRIISIVKNKLGGILQTAKQPGIFFVDRSDCILSTFNLIDVNISIIPRLINDSNGHDGILSLLNINSFGIAYLKVDRKPFDFLLEVIQISQILWKFLKKLPILIIFLYLLGYFQACTWIHLLAIGPVVV